MDKLFSNKRTYTGSDGDEYMNMSIPVIDVSAIKGYTAERTTQDDNGRIDRYVWNNVEKNLDMIDLVMYANHIFNPFAVKESTLLYIPNDTDSVYVRTSEPSLPDGTKYSNNTKGEKTKTYAETIEYLAKQGLGIK